MSGTPVLAPTLFVVVGATGTGKTAISLDLAEVLADAGRGAEIVNCDAMQLYRGMNIGTAKLSEASRRGVPHHLFDSLEVTEEATVAWYQPTARALISDILQSGKHAILVGGSGLYVSSVIFDFQFPPRDEKLRATLEADLEAHGVEHLLDRLRSLDEVTAGLVDNRNPRRVVRALEVALLGGDAQVTLPTEPALWQSTTRLIGVRSERSALVGHLDARVETMWQEGLLDEVSALIPLGLERGKTASRAIGYHQALAQLRGECTEEVAIEETKALTRRYARRQVSWFKRYQKMEWIDTTVRLPEAAELSARFVN